MGGRGASAPFIPEPLRIAMPEPEPGSMRFVPPAPGSSEYTAITIYKRLGVQPHAREPLYAVWIDMPGIEPQPGTVWQVVQRIEVTTEQPIPAALCGLLLMSETTGDRLFRQIADTWLGLVEDDPLDDYDRYASREETRDSLNRAYTEAD